MKISTIDLLHKGQKRHVDKQEYSKIRNYSRINSSRPAQADSRMSSTASSVDLSKVTQKDLIEVNDSVRKQSLDIIENSRTLLKEIRKCEKIDRLILKKIQYITQEEQQTGESTQNSESRLKKDGLSSKEFQFVFELKLALDVIKLQEIFQDKNQVLHKISSNKGREQQEIITEALFYQKIKLLQLSIENSQKIHQKIEELRTQEKQLKQKVVLFTAKQKNFKKQHDNLVKKLEGFQYEIKELKESAEEKKKRNRKNSCEYIQNENGQLKNHQDIRRELNEMKSLRVQENENMQSFLEQKMLQKITLINEIQKYEQLCKNSNLKLHKQSSI